MTKKMKLVWRLGKLPSVEELRELVKDKLITQEEAREILFNQETEEEKDIKSLEAEVTFLKEVIEKLSHNRSYGIVEVIKTVEKPYYRQWPWYNGTITYLSSGGIGSTGGNGIINC